MPNGRESQANLSQEFHDIMLSATTGSSHRGPPISQGGSPSVFQDASSQRQSLPNTRNQPMARPFRPAFGSSDKGAYAELKENYSILQQGFITLEAKYKRRQAEVRKHQEELRLRTEEYASQTDALTEQLAIKDKESKSLHSELKEIVHTTRAVKNIIEQTLSELANRLRCPICSKLLQVPHSLGCLHVACCTCIIDSFQRNGANCPVCQQPCTQLPMQDTVITGILSFAYTLHRLEEPTFASLGLDPDIFAKNLSIPGRPLEEHQGDIQPQPQTLQDVASTHRQDEQSVGGGDGMVSVNTGEDGVDRITDIVGDVAANEKALAVGPSARTAAVLGEDINMEDNSA